MKLRKKCIFLTEILYDSTLVQSFIDVMNGKQTDIKIIEENKLKFTSLFGELETLSQTIEGKEREIHDLCMKLEKNPEIENKKKLLNEQVNAFMTNLQTYINMYDSKYDQLKQRLNYYNKQQNKIYEMINEIYTYRNKRTEEKIFLLQYITKKTIVPP